MVSWELVTVSDRISKPDWPFSPLHQGPYVLEPLSGPPKPLALFQATEVLHY